MTYIVTENCIRCKYMDCVEVCPVDCFYEGENMLVIHPDECIDCGVCEPECPAEAIVPDTEPGSRNGSKLTPSSARYGRILLRSVVRQMMQMPGEGRPRRRCYFRRDQVSVIDDLRRCRPPRSLAPNKVWPIAPDTIADVGFVPEADIRFGTSRQKE